MTTYAIHPFAAAWPSMDAETYTAFLNDIRAHGQIAPITLYEGQILDGIHRDRACRELGLPVQVTTFNGTATDALAFVFSQNLHRRNLTPGQRADMIAQFVRLEQGTNRYRQKVDGQYHPSSPPLTVGAAARIVNVSPTTIKSAVAKRRRAEGYVRPPKQKSLSTTRPAPRCEICGTEKTLERVAGPKPHKRFRCLACVSTVLAHGQVIAAEKRAAAARDALEAHRATLPEWLQPLAEGTTEDQLIFQCLLEEWIKLKHMAAVSTHPEKSFKEQGWQLGGRAEGWMRVQDRKKFLNVFWALSHALSEGKPVPSTMRKPWER